MTIKKVEDAGEKQDDKKVTEKKNIIKVVAQLPVRPVRIEEDEEAIYHYVTIEEYLTAQANRSE
jgi:hypothetical protein